MRISRSLIHFLSSVLIASTLCASPVSAEEFESCSPSLLNTHEALVTNWADMGRVFSNAGFPHEKWNELSYVLPGSPDTRFFERDAELIEKFFARAESLIRLSSGDSLWMAAEGTQEPIRILILMIREKVLPNPQMSDALAAPLESLRDLRMQIRECLLDRRR